jgi:hypothetical protein
MGAITGTTALIIAGVGTAVAGTSAGMSFAQAAKAKKTAEAATAASKKLMEEAERQAEIEFFGQLNVPLDAYGREYEQNLQAQQQGIQALQEGDSRYFSAGVGRVGAGAVAANENTRISMGKELYDLQKLQVQEQSDINQDLKDMKVGAAADQSMISRDAQEAQAAAMAQGVASVGSAIGSAASAVPLFVKSGADKAAQKVLGQLDSKLTQNTIANPNGITPEGIAAYKKFSSKTIEVNGNTVENPDYDPKQAALFAPTTTSPIGSGVMMNKLTQNYSKKELQEMAQGYKDDKGFYDEAFYDQFYTP